MSTDFRTSEGLRSLLIQLEDAGPDGWREDPQARDLMCFAMEKYGALAHAHGLEPEDAAYAAFEVMRTAAVRRAWAPWAVVTRAVQVTLIADERATGLVCSTAAARHLVHHDSHDARRIFDRDDPLCNYHPAFHLPAAEDEAELDPEDRPASTAAEPTNAFQALDIAIALFVRLGWTEQTARYALEYICSRLVIAGSRSTAHEYLRRDYHALAQLDLDRRGWAALMRVVLGSPDPHLAHTRVGHGVLQRILCDERQAELLRDDDLVLAIIRAIPGRARSSHA
ncbi:serine/arginine repetitive matrix protein 2 [Nocardioides sp. BGMRC 2183]|nr:serine/arginine repetitive matrix protein 2 [Nocardioides sp. BGMRC 2183]